MKNKEAKSIFSSLENFSSIPPPELWDKIEAQLDQPKKKKRAIIWWAIAASLVVGLSVPTILYFNTNQENGFERNLENNNNSNVNNNVNSNDYNDINTKGDNNDTGKLNDNRINLNNSNQIATGALPTLSSKTKDYKGFKNLKSNRNNVINQTVKDESKSNAIVSNQNSSSDISVSELINVKETQVNNFDTNSKSVGSKDKNAILGSNENKGIAANTSSKDSLNKIKMEVAQLENVLIELDKDKTVKKKDSENIDKWSIQVFAGVMSSQNYNNQKALGNDVASKQSSGYGVKTNYKLNKKWSVSSGLKINELGQEIAGVSYYEQQSYSGIVMDKLPVVGNDYQLITLSGNYDLVSISNNEGYLFASNSNADNGFEKGDVTQNLKYFEMPLEVSYALLNKKKTNISMNTGGFVGMLISNDLLLNGNSIGENKNVNQYVYGTLLSSTLQYEFYKKTKFFIEPGMNYYINPLENQTFNQFQWMFNVGLNVSF
ncbi:hypothetical protein [Flavobacterium laiguense]|uniref:Outer membrane protein beta-barrel domain-containing protein n=1 Tax=Flavobacterium laiguense TaxID=2169409 RepID=A0A2U1JX94_9FLAO|nr:hypothetical protein [Flavobacterium laiguense]PWA09564.1 hypothetical protein DB891_07740 [Flavobacterium laiguense]